MTMPCASSADLVDKTRSFEELADGVYALTAEGDPNVGAVEGSPLSTPAPDRPFTGRPPRGQLCDPCPGVILPDVPVPGGRLRALCRDGFLVLLGGMCDSGLFAQVLGKVCTAPLVVRELAEIDGSGRLAERLGAGPDEAWLIRPDARIAAIIPHAGADSTAAAVRRASRLI